MGWLVVIACAFGCADEDGGRESGSGPSIGSLSNTASDTETGPSEGTTSGTASATSASTPDGSVGESDDPPKFDLPPGTGDTEAPPNQDCDPELVATLRDFSQSHPDFESVIAVDPGIVAETLGADGLPVYAGGTAGTTTGQASFDQWYRDVAGVNMNLPITIALVDQGNGTFVYESAAFFPIDGQGFGNEGNAHNYHFTLEMHAQFTYEGGEVFTFRGDDDLFTFVNGHLAIDLGGVHGPLVGTVDFDAMAAQLGITPGNTYPIDFFFAERHTTESNFRIETTIGCFHPPG